MKRRLQVTLGSWLVIVTVASMSSGCRLFGSPRAIMEGEWWRGRYRYEVRDIDGVTYADGRFESFWQEGHRHVVARCKKSPIPPRFVARDDEWKWPSWPDFRFHGTCVIWYQTGPRAYKVEFDEGVLHGTWLRYWENGRVLTRGRYAQGKKVGKWTYWHENDRKNFEGQYVEGLKHGTWRYWNEEGRLLGTNVFDRGTGQVVHWWPDGQPLESYFTTNGHIEGLMVQWYPTGQKKYESRWRTNDYDGLWEKWHPTGEKAAEGYFSNGIPVGTWTDWDTNGVVTRSQVYSNYAERVRAEDVKDAFAQVVDLPADDLVTPNTVRRIVGDHTAHVVPVALTRYSADWRTRLQGSPEGERAFLACARIVAAYPNEVLRHFEKGFASTNGPPDLQLRRALLLWAATLESPDAFVWAIDHLVDDQDRVLDDIAGDGKPMRICDAAYNVALDRVREVGDEFGGERLSRMTDISTRDSKLYAFKLWWENDRDLEWCPDTAQFIVVADGTNEQDCSRE